MGQASLRDEAGEPRQQAEIHRPRRGQRAGRRVCGGDAQRAGLQRAGASASRIRPGGRTASRRRAASTRPRTTGTTATASTGCSTTPSRAATSAPARRTSIAWRRSASRSSTSASRRACRSPGSTAACWPTARSAARRCPAPSTPGGRPGSSFCSARTRQLEKEIARGGVQMFPRTEMLDLIVIEGRARGIVVRDLVTGQDRVPPRRRGGARDGRLRQRLLPVHQRQRLQRHRHLAGPQARRRLRQSLLHADPSRPASR